MTPRNGDLVNVASPNGRRKYTNVGYSCVTTGSDNSAELLYTSPSSAIIWGTLAMHLYTQYSVKTLYLMLNHVIYCTCAAWLIVWDWQNCRRSHFESQTAVTQTNNEFTVRGYCSLLRRVTDLTVLEWKYSCCRIRISIHRSRNRRTGDPSDQTDL